MILAGTTLLGALYAFFTEHQYCGELDAAVEGDRVWMMSRVARGSSATPIATDQRGRAAGARRDLRLDSRQPSSTGVPMRLIGLAVILALPILPFAAEALELES